MNYSTAEKVDICKGVNISHTEPTVPGIVRLKLFSKDITWDKARKNNPRYYQSTVIKNSIFVFGTITDPGNVWP